MNDVNLSSKGRAVEIFNDILTLVELEYNRFSKDQQ